MLASSWPWYISGPLIGLTVPLLLLLGNKHFGVSSSLRHICAACMPAKLPYFQYDWKKEQWNLFFVAGIVLGSALAVWAFPNPSPFQIAASTQADLGALGIRDFQQMMPVEIFDFSQLFTLKGLIFGVIGGFLVGFGTRYAGGCTSGHAIMGLSNLQWPSLVATISFMAGGFFCTWVLLPIVLRWVMG